MVQVTISDGVLEGELINNEFGGTYCSFKGIPYAEPPVGDMRFKAPQPIKPWKGVRSAKEHGPICYQYDPITKSVPLGSEDCLYLNVYTPEMKPSNTIPVMVFIHGGGFVFGSGNDDFYGPEFIVRQGVILVTFNYRLETVGFLCLHTEDVPGNAGMKDQVAALRWVKKNISNFGGDPENVTIFGESAGAVSVTYHLISPMTKGLFRRAIAQSGAATCWWAQGFEPRERAIALARKLGMESEDDKELFEFFKSQPIKSLIQVRVPITLTEVVKESNDMQFGVVSERQFGDNERFFFEEEFDAVRNGIHDGVEFLAGYCENEGLTSLAYGVNLENLLLQANNYPEFFAPKEVTLNCSIREQLEAGRKIKQFYFKNQNVTMDNLDQLIAYYASKLFIYGIVEFLKICASKNKNDKYLYKFTCKSERNVLAHIVGLGPIIGEKSVVCHADDLAYMFHMKIIPQKVDIESKTFKMIDNVVKLWTNFAKHGNPTPDASLGVQWAPYTVQNQDYLDIGEELVAGTAPDKEEIEFWEDIFREYLPGFVA